MYTGIHMHRKDHALKPNRLKNSINDVENFYILPSKLFCSDF